ncbi:hypothetical protein J3E64_001427 [Sphingobium sp. OAS761]|uniref:serine/threonine protein kinase n=1 Tax=Sphingobium sp. OAS761 TaxID=2817901 RepID=UPI0020A1B9C4|nr:serine/threonine-protein kinase [Sphingobium sp. OAS761]MCP1469745.1 hypothetical protein [Sphingobium sp. OAS761]
MASEADVLKIVEAALALEDQAARAALVCERCGGDAALQARVETLLARDDTDFRLLPTDSFARPLSVIDDIPQRIGPFRVTGEIARGGMGAVVRAERDDGLFQQVVAIKLIRGDIASPRAKARFAEERRILARLRHPGIVRIVDGGDADNRPWLAMDFIEGAPIDQALHAKSASLEDRLSAFEAVCEAVAFAHRQLVVHADIKPSNVLFDGEGRVHLLDFGIARLIAALDTDEAGDPYPLTKGYAAPERAVGTMPTVASDVFSLGMLLLAILDKPVPRDGTGLVEGTRLPQGILQGDLAAIAGRALAERPEDRYSDVPELLEDIRRHRDYRPVRAQGDAGWRYLASRFAYRNRRALVIGSAAAVLLLGTSVVTTVQYWRAERARAQADARFVEVRSLARFLLFDAYDRLADAPGTVEVRARMADTARTYLDRLRTVPGSPPDLQLDLARSYRRLATIQGLSSTANLGRPRDAIVSLRKAEALLAPLAKAHPNDPAILTEQGWIWLARWSLYSDTAGGADNDRAAHAFAQALALRPGDAEALLGQFVAMRNRAFDLETADQHARSIALSRETLSGLRKHVFPARWLTEAKILEFTLLRQVGDASYYAGDLPGALATYREGEALVRAQLAQGPSVRWEGRLAQASYDVASTLADDLAKEGEAMALTQHAIDRLNSVRATGGDAALDFGMLMLLDEKSMLLQAMGRKHEAVAVSSEQIAMREARLAAQTGDVTRMRDLAVVLAAHGEMQAGVGRKAQACAAALRGLALLDALAKNGDLAARDNRLEYPKLEAVRDRYCR